MYRLLRLAVICAVGLVPALAGCAQSVADPSGSASSGLSVVASTNVWGAVATVVGGSKATVSSVIANPAADPHSYEASARTQLAVSRAQVVVVNGGGYDDFMNRLLAAARSRATVINAVDVSGRAAAAKAAGTDLNEHVWYDLPSVEKVADRIAAVLGAADPRNAATFRANAAAFRGRLEALIAREDAARSRTQGAGVAITEPLPLYMLQALGAVNRTPPAFSHAVEAGDDVAPAVLAQTTALFTGGAVRALVYNEQTATAQTTAVRQAAAAAHVPVVGVTETLPAGKSYLQWMTDNLDALSAALS